MTHFGYSRISTNQGQKDDRQIAHFKELGIKERDIYRDTISGTKIQRPKLNELLSIVEEGDVIHITELSRLGRSLRDLLRIVDYLHQKGVLLVSKKENVNTTDPSGRLYFNMMASFAEFEREILLERQQEGIALAKRQGKYKGGKKKLNDKDVQLLRDMKDSGKYTNTDIAKRLGISIPTIYNYYNAN